MYCRKWREVESFFLYTFKRYTHGKDHWSQIKKKIHSTDKALEHFDDFYGSAFGGRWPPIRKALLRRRKYVALVNNYGDDEETMKLLERMGAYNMKTLFAKYMESNKNEDRESTNDRTQGQFQDDRIKAYAEKVSQGELAEIYTGNESVELPKVLNTGGAIIGRKESLPKDNTHLAAERAPMDASMAASLSDADLDMSRLVQPELGMTASALWTFIPSTRIMGRDDWLPESHQYKYYTDAADFPLAIEDDEHFEFPENLNVYSFENDNNSSFPEPKSGATGVLNYYVMDGSSILPVIALGMNYGDRVLDMCAAPGGKSLTILQTMRADVIVANDSSLSRINRIQKVFNEYLYDFASNDKWRERIVLSQSDGVFYSDQQGFDRVLVDVPCTIDRHSLKEADNNIFKPSRNKERLKLPELQASLLCNALSVCRVGGTVVYSTCSLSPIQNDGVVHLALKQAFEEKGIKATIKLFTKSIQPIKALFRVGEGRMAPRYGHLITPHVSANFGPAYFSKLVRTQ